MNGLTDVGIILRRSHPGQHRAACPECAKVQARPKDDALAVKVEGDGGATWLCQRCGWKGGISGKRGAMPRVYKAAIKAHAPLPAESEKPFPDAARRLWGECQAIETGTIAASYLSARGCALPHPDGDLRFHPSLRHPDGHTGPALVGLVTDATDIEGDSRDCTTPKRLTLHRTWIAATGKADIERPRLLWAGGRKKGGVIRLWPDDEVTTGLAIAEGIETTLTLARVFPAVWSVIDAGNMAELPVLAGIEALTIVADNDEHGRGLKAAWACENRWREAGVDTRVWLSTDIGADLNDWRAA